MVIIKIVNKSILDSTEKILCQQCDCTSKKLYGLSQQIHNKYPSINPYKYRYNSYDEPGTVIEMISDNGIIVLCMMSRCSDDTHEKRLSWFQECLNTIDDSEYNRVTMSYDDVYGDDVASSYKEMLENCSTEIILYSNCYYIYTDGACSNNGKEGAKAGIGIYFGENDARNVSRRVDGKQTNNIAELLAIISVYDIIKEDLEQGESFTIVSDSVYAIRCATDYGEKHSKNGFTKNIPNKELVKRIYKLYNNICVNFKFCKAHTNNMDIHSIGNRQADLLATQSLQE
jgi:ribonuclease HI